MNKKRFKKGDRVYVVCVELDETYNDGDEYVKPMVKYRIVFGVVCDFFDNRQVKVRHTIRSSRWNDVVIQEGYWYKPCQVFKRMPSEDEIRNAIDDGILCSIESDFNTVDFLMKSINDMKSLRKRVKTVSVLREGEYIK